jgi:ribosomal protein S18 acetylase RimI-like enzyme
MLPAVALGLGTTETAAEQAVRAAHTWPRSARLYTKLVLFTLRFRWSTRLCAVALLGVMTWGFVSKVPKSSFGNWGERRSTLSVDVNFPRGSVPATLDAAMRDFEQIVSNRVQVEQVRTSGGGWSAQMVVRFTQIDYDREMAFVAVTEDANMPSELGVGRCLMNPDGNSVEFALVVADDCHCLGIGSKLMTTLMQTAKAKGISFFEGEVLVINKPMLSLVTKLGFSIETIADDNEVVPVIPFDIVVLNVSFNFSVFDNLASNIYCVLKVNNTILFSGNLSTILKSCGRYNNNCFFE